MNACMNCGATTLLVSVTIATTVFLAVSPEGSKVVDTYQSPLVQVTCQDCHAAQAGPTTMEESHV